MICTKQKKTKVSVISEDEWIRETSERLKAARAAEARVRICIVARAAGRSGLESIRL